MINKNIAVLCGGWSEERLISLKSGDSVFKCLKENGYEVSKIDVKTASEAFNKELYSEFDLVFILFIVILEDCEFDPVNTMSFSSKNF